MSYYAQHCKRVQLSTAPLRQTLNISKKQNVRSVIGMTITLWRVAYLQTILFMFRFTTHSYTYSDTCVKRNARFRLIFFFFWGQSTFSYRMYYAYGNITTIRRWEKKTVKTIVIISNCNKVTIYSVRFKKKKKKLKVNKSRQLRMYWLERETCQTVSRKSVFAFSPRNFRRW